MSPTRVSRPSVAGMNRRLLVIVVTLATALTACGGEEEVLGLGDRDLARCSLVTVEEAEDWLGAPVEAAPSEGFDGEPNPVTCLYRGATGSILVQVRDGAVYHAEPGSPSRLGEDVPGIGEDAFRDNDSVQFLQNDWSVSVSQIGGIPNVESLTEMARLVAGRLP